MVSPLSANTILNSDWGKKCLLKSDVEFQVLREGYGIVCGTVYFCVDDVLDKFDGVVGNSVNLCTENNTEMFSIKKVQKESAKNP